MGTPSRRSASVLLACVAGLAILVSACAQDDQLTSPDAVYPSFGLAPPPAPVVTGSTIPDSEFLDESGTSDVEMGVVDNTFEKDQLLVSAGATVTFTNNGRNDHNIVSVDGAFKTIEQQDFVSGDVVTITFDTPGDYAYYCSIHGTPTAGQNGIIRVI